MPPVGLDSFADVAGGQTIAGAKGSGESYVVGPTRADKSSDSSG